MLLTKAAEQIARLVTSGSDYIGQPLNQTGASQVSQPTLQTPSTMPQQPVQLPPQQTLIQPSSNIPNLQQSSIGTPITSGSSANIPTTSINNNNNNNNNNLQSTTTTTTTPLLSPSSSSSSSLSTPTVNERPVANAGHPFGPDQQ